MEGQNGKDTSVISLKDLLIYLKKNIVLILVVVILFGVAGGVYSYVRKPQYIVSQQLNYVAKLENKDSSVLNNVTVMEKYLNTVQDFFKQSVVVDRANYYWLRYSNDYKNSDKYSSIDEALSAFYDDVASNKITYVIGANSGNYYILENISISNDSQEDCFWFNVSYKEGNLLEAKQKLKIYTIAYSKEINSATIDSESVYFEGVSVIIKDLGYMGYREDMSMTKLIVIFAIIGFALSLILVYLKQMLNSTVRTATELAEITGNDVLGVIISQEGKKNDK